MRILLKKFLVLTLILILAWPGVAGADEVVSRLSGSDRYSTAAAVSNKGWDAASVVVLARGDDYADALAGVPLAYRLGAPILLVEPNRLPSVTRQELIRLSATQVIILGGTGAVSDGVATSLKNMGLEVERIAGSDRFDTAAKIAARVAPYGTNAVVVANGRNFPDALAAAPYAAVAGYPILLVERDTIPAVTANAIKGVEANEAIVVGGTSVVSSHVLSKLPGAHRISGSDRYATAVALAKHFNPLGEGCFIATGRDFADAITGAVLAARRESGILLVGTSVPAVVRKFMTEAEMEQACILGGTGAVSTSVANAIRNILTGTLESGVGITGWTTPGATVKIAGKTGIADDEGFYQISSIPVGRHTAEFRLEGYRTETVPVNVGAQQYSVLNADLQVLNPQDIFLQGAVVEKGSGRPMAGVKVIVATMSPEGDWLEETVLTTNSRGIYSLANAAKEDQEPGTVVRNVLRFGAGVRLTIRQDADEEFRGGYHAKVLTLTLKTDDVSNIAEGVELVRIKEMTISGTVTKPDGKAVGKEKVTLAYGDKTIKTETDEHGNYSFLDRTLPAGKYVITVDYPDEEGYAVYRREIPISEGKDLVHNIKLVQGYKVEVEVKPAKDGEEFHAGVYNAALVQGGAGISAEPLVLQDSAETLAFSWDRVAPGSYTVRISGDYVITKTFSLQVSSSDVKSANQRVTRAGTISGSVKDTEGEALADAKLELLNTSGKVVGTAVADSAGRYCFGGLAGGSKHSVRASHPGYRTVTSKQIQVTVNADKEQDFALEVFPAIAEVSGWVQTAGIMIPAANADMQFRVLDVHGKDPGELFKGIKVGAKGEYLVKLLPGVYTVVIKDPGRHETLETTLKVAAGDVLENHNYKLQPGGNARLTVKVEDSNGRSVDGIELFDKWGDLLGAVKSGGVFSNLSAGTYTLRASGGKNHEDLEVTVSIKKGEKLTRSYTLMPSAKVFDVDFWVVGEKNKSLAGVRIIVESGGKQVAQRVTDSKGKALVRLPAGEYTARLYADSYLLHTLEFKVVNKGIDIPVIRLEKW